MTIIIYSLSNNFGNSTITSIKNSIIQKIKLTKKEKWIKINKKVAI